MDDFLGKMRKLKQVFWAVNELMEQTSQLTPADLDLFENLCSTFGRMWRAYLPGASVAPKLHHLDSHMPAQMRQFGCW